MRYLLTEFDIVFMDEYPPKLWRGGYLGHMTKTSRINFRSPILEATYEFGLIRSSGFREATDVRTDAKGATLSYKHTYEPLAQVSEHLAKTLITLEPHRIF